MQKLKDNTTVKPMKFLYLQEWMRIGLQEKE